MHSERRKGFALLLVAGWGLFLLVQCAALAARYLGESGRPGALDWVTLPLNLVGALAGLLLISLGTHCCVRSRAALRYREETAGFITLALVAVQVLVAAALWVLFTFSIAPNLGVGK